jgi:hypothetical protein
MMIEVSVKKKAQSGDWASFSFFFREEKLAFLAPNATETQKACNDYG